jgi:hypothetical protein
LWLGGAFGINFARLMKSVCDAASAKDAMVEGGTLMAGAIDRIAVRVIAGVVASARVRRVKGWRAGAHGDGYRAE